MFFDSAYQVLRVLVVGTLSYAAVVAILRISGKRTLAKLNAFDLVVSVALGSTLATTLLSSDVALVEGVLAISVLVAGQLAVSWLSVRWRPARRLARSAPTYVLLDGELLDEVLRQQRVTADEVRQAVRSTGAGSLAELAAVVLETDGTLSVISRSRIGDGSALVDLTDPHSHAAVEPAA